MKQRLIPIPSVYLHLDRIRLDAIDRGRTDLGRHAASLD